MVSNLPLIRDRQRFVRDSNGAAALIFALAFPVMLGFAGLAIEVGSWFLNQRAMQGAADAAAVSAATAWALDPTFSLTAQCPTNVCINEALSVAGMNGWRNGNGITVVANSPPVSGPYAGNTSAVQVTITRPGTNWFSSLLPGGYTAPTLGANSVALAQPGIDCMLSLDQGNTTGISFILTDIPLSGPGIDMPNCGIGVNSTNPLAALSWVGDVPVHAYSAAVVGGVFPNLGTILPSLGLGFEWTKAPITGPAPPGPPTPDPYMCPGNQCRTMPAPTLPGWIPPLGTDTTTCSSPTTVTTSGALPGCSQGVTVTSGTVTLRTAAGANYTIMPQCTTIPIPPRRPGGPSGTRTTCTPAISVSGGATLNITGGGNLTIPNTAAGSAPGIKVTDGTLNLTTGTNIIRGTNQPGILVTGGTMTITATSNSVLGGSGQPGVSITGGTLTFATGTETNKFQGGRNGAGIEMSGGTLSVNAATNNVLAGRRSPAILVDGDGGQLTFGDGNNYIQGAQSDQGANPAMLIQGSSDVAFGNGTSVFGGPQVTPGVPAVDDQSGFPTGSRQGLTFGSGNYTFMEGISVTGGDLTLNPSGTSAGVGYYIMVGGSSNALLGGGGFNMTAGDLTGSNATIVLTGGAAGNIDAADYANINFYGANGMTLTAPTAGPTAGIAIFQDRNATAANANTFSGGSFFNVTGAIYTPSQSINVLGVGLMSSRCLQMIASTIAITGIIYMNDNCDGTGTAPIISDGSVVLVQ